MSATLLTPISECPQSLRPVHVLTLTPFYPSFEDETRGCFVAEPLELTERLGVRNTVFAVQPFYRSRVNVSASAPPAHWMRWFSLPSGFGLPSSGVFLFAKLLKKIRELRLSTPIDLIHAHGALPCGHAAALVSRELGIPFVVTVHGLDAFSANQVKGLVGMWAGRVSRHVYQLARRVVCVSEKVRQQVANSLSNFTSTTVIHNGVDEKLFYQDDKAELSNTVLSVGNLIPTKGHALLLRAFLEIAQQFPEFVLKIIGEGPELSRLRKLVTNLNLVHKVDFIGHQSRQEVAQAMQQCTIFALPSSYEGLGCAYLEAMSTGKPVIGCSGQGIEDVISHGVNGWLVRPNDKSELVAALSSLLANVQLRRRLGNAARQTILQNFTLEHQSDRLSRVYRESAA
ncbi:MAG TPA: glycosyltransferase [Terriglobales bacterium]|nr:glycosyltransferase [Terriglobales bacterium]